MDPSVKRLAIMTEDHPGSYIDFEGTIPEGNYGAGTVLVWDTGTYQSESDIETQIASGKLRFSLFGNKVSGGFSMVKTRNKNWLLIKSSDQYASQEAFTETMPDSVLSGMTIDPKKRRKLKTKPKGNPSEFPATVRPMLATPIDKPFDNDNWVYEVKWDGVRALLFIEKSKGILALRSRKGGDITQRYPEVVSDVASALRHDNSVVLDGEIVILDKNGIPDFQRHQKRMNVDSSKEIALLSKSLPATYYVFDILYLDGLDLRGLDFIERRKILTQILDTAASPGTLRISEYFEGQGRSLFQKAMQMKLEGIVAKHKYGAYESGSRSSAWLKIKGIQTQDCVVIGYTRGEGNRSRLFGSLILAVYRNGKLEFAGHSGTGFGFDQLESALQIMQKFVTGTCPIEHVPYVNREPVWLRPELVAEVKFHGWTRDGIMRAPVFVRFRDDKKPEECKIETPRPTATALANAPTETHTSEKRDAQPFTNLKKVFWPATPKHRAFTKGDLIKYYQEISEFILPQLRNRPLSLNRYPDGIGGKSFFHKNWEQDKPEFVDTVKVFSESSQRTINYLVCNNQETLAWLANLGCIEMHPWYSRVRDFSACAQLALDQGEHPLLEENCGLDQPDFIVLDLDPYIFSGREKRDQEPEYNARGFKAAVQVAMELKDLLDSLRIESFVKTSGKTGLHILIPIDHVYSYDQTRKFAEIVGRMLLGKDSAKAKITMDWSTYKRKGKVFFDYNQNSRGKTIASVFSARPTRTATVSMPVDWRKLDGVLPTDFTILNALEILKKSGDPWRDLPTKRQDLASILKTVSEAE